MPQNSKHFDPGSFRDPDGRVFRHNGAICRTVHARRRDEIAQLLRSDGFLDLVQSGLVLATEVVKASDLQLDAAVYGDTILHQRQIPFVSYPCEWSFEMLRQAALATLTMIKKAISWGYILKDATAFNIVFEGRQPRFVDILSFVPHQSGAAWHSYGQFCRSFLYPLLIASYRKIDVRPWLQTQSLELSPAEALKYFSGRDFMKPGVFKDIFLAAKLEAVSTQSAASVQKQAIFSNDIIIANIDRLTGIIKNLKSPYQSGTEWSDYANNTSYSDDGINSKKTFVTEAIKKSSPKSVLDIGANTGVYSQIAAQLASDYVIAIDGDPGAVEGLYTSLKDGDHIFPVVANLAAPTPATGWSLSERPSLLQRSKTDFFLALAVIHHLRISAGVPFDKIIDQLADLAPAGVIEWVDSKDAMVQKLMALRDCEYPDFDYEKFRALLEQRFKVVAEMPLKDGARRLMYVVGR